MHEFNNINQIPTSLSQILNNNSEALDYYSNLDKPGRDELIQYANEFKSKEELERYVYYLTDNDFK